jgi:glutathione S-transferase
MISDLYYINACPGARAVRLWCRKMGLKVNEILMDFKKGEHMTEEFLKLNPMHTVPTVVLENGESLYESRLILKYLNENKNSLEIDKWLFWDLGFLNTNVGKVIYPRLFMNSEPTQKDIDRLVEKLEHLNKHLENNSFLVDNKLSIADISSAMLIYNSQIRNDLVDVFKYHNIVKWLENIKHEFKTDDWDAVMIPFLEWTETL